MEKKVKDIVVLGAGFGGLTAALKLSKAIKKKGLADSVRLTLVNNTAYQLYTPALYEIASIPKEEAAAVRLKTSVSIDLQEVAARRGFRFLGGAAVGLDREKKVIKFADGESASFDELLVALGAETNYFNIPGLEEHSFPLKTFGDAIRLRNKVESVVLSGKSPVNIVIGGAGATGVELAAEFNNFLCALKERLMPEEKTCNTYVILIDGAESILPGFEPWMQKKASRRLKELGIDVRLGKLVAGVNGQKISFKDGSSLPYDIFVWSGGVKPVSALKNFGLPLTPKGKIAVNEYLEARLPTLGPSEDGRAAPGINGIYAVGDNAELINTKTGKPLPGNVPVAEGQARRAAKNIIADILGRPRRKYRPLKKYPYILAVGGKYALADLIFIRFSGFLGWVAQQLVELRYLIFVLGLKRAFSMWRVSVKYQASND